WDVQLDPDWLKFAEMIGGAAHWARRRGKKTVLGGMSPTDPNWLRLMCERGVVQYIDAVGVHGFPARLHFNWQGWQPHVQQVRDVLAEHGLDPEIWITETGYSTWRHDEQRQLTAFVDAVRAPVSRVYWYSTYDLDPAAATNGGFHSDERDYFFGLKHADGAPKLLYRIWAEGGVDAVSDAYWLGKSPHVAGRDRPVMITGGSGFVGVNLADRLLSQGRQVLLFDNLSRPGVERNLQ